ncbi:MAG: hypothetical protein ABIP06_08270 [Pyrinomonadaceae bacterium]
MIKKFILTIFLILLAFGASIFAQLKTDINSVKAKNLLLGKHKLSLQWISWDYFGTAMVMNKRGVFYLKGKQKSRKDSDFVEVDGIITEINDKDFKFNGTVTMQVSHINNGKPCERTGVMTFAITGKRKYWRLQEIKSPCDVTTDYVDIYFR